MSRGPDACTLISRALAGKAAAAGCAVILAGSDTRRWASATFAGARHVLTVAAQSSPALDDWLAGLPDAEFALRGHLVADLAVTGVSRDGDAVTIALEILTVEER